MAMLHHSRARHRHCLRLSADAKASRSTFSCLPGIVLLLVIAYSVRRLPFVVRSASAATAGQPSLEEAAQNLALRATPEGAAQDHPCPHCPQRLVAGACSPSRFSMLKLSVS